MKKAVTFGEIMLRLKTMGSERFFQSPCFEAVFGGGEANVAVGLAQLGIDAAYVTAVPDNAIGEACIRELKKYGVDTGSILKEGERLGIYFLEGGAAQRPSSVIYDRAHSAFAEIDKSRFDWEKIFENAFWFHISGITPAVSLSAAEAAVEAAAAAKKKGLTVSCDLNYRRKLWKYGKSAPEVMSEIVKYSDILIGNEEDCQRSLGISADIEPGAGRADIEKYKKLTDKVLSIYPNIKIIAVTLRESLSADCNGWSALLNDRSSFFVSKRYEIDRIVDRVGSGDSFSAALIYGLSCYTKQAALDFAAAASCLKHSVPGDFPLFTKQEIEDLLKSGGTGRIQR